MNGADVSSVKDETQRRSRRPKGGRGTLTVGLLVLLVLSGVGADARPEVLFSVDGWRNAAPLLSGFLSPDLSAAFLGRVAMLLVESIAIGALGLLVSVSLGLPMALVAARLPGLTDPPARSRTRARFFSAVRFVARAVLAFWRAVPEIVWAFLFVRIFGLGPGPAVLAIGLTFAGIIGKLFAELLEACDPEPIRTMRRAGAGWTGVLVTAALPQVRSQWLAYALFRFECAVRSAAILGVVGAGGIGAEIDLAIRYFEYDKLATALLAVWVTLLVFETASAFLRPRRSVWSVGLLAVGSVAAWATLEVSWGSMLEGEAATQVGRFLAGFFPPTLDGAFVLGSLGLVVETLAMAFFGTGLAAVAAFFLCPFATRILTYGGTLCEPPGKLGPSAVAGWLVFSVVRMVFQVTRALPELIWALMFVVWVGPGPFAGALAVAAHTFGILGRLFAETQEEAEPPAARFLESIGTTAVGRWLYAVIPQVAPRLAAYALFRFEVNVRATAMVGFVGAGGLGDAIHTAISLFHMGDLAALLLLLFSTVLAVDAAGSAVRRGLLRA